MVQRDPMVTSKEVATVDRLSGRRCLFGVGAGWSRQEMANHGTEPAARAGGRKWAHRGGAGAAHRGRLDLPAHLRPRRARPAGRRDAGPRAGRDRRHRSVSVFAASRQLEQLAEVGVTRSVLMVPPAGRDEVLARLDRDTELLARMNG